MSFPNPVEHKSHDVINNKLSRVMKEVAEESMKMAAVKEYSSSPDNLLTVSGDGTWKTRGHSSLIDTDDEPMHWFCPTNPNTWCKYNAAINNNLQNYKHKPSVAKDVRDVIKPVFADLSHPALLKKCLGEKFGLKINRNVCVSLAERDNRRIFTSRQRCLQSSFEARRAKKIKRVKKVSCFRNRKREREKKRESEKERRKERDRVREREKKRKRESQRKREEKKEIESEKERRKERDRDRYI
ncbi:hypothetical protein TNCV_2723351 [Trichonephila clavipes]|nr:hypothetical protein TNCV_2723351 [Trichonephila clavipes]